MSPLYLGSVFGILECVFGILDFTYIRYLGFGTVYQVIRVVYWSKGAGLR